MKLPIIGGLVKVRLAFYLGFFFMVIISIFLSQKIDYRPSIFTSSEGIPGRAALVTPPGVVDFNALVICSHGTNSHKEVFLPIASLMALQGISSIVIDSLILSTDEGISKRVEEIRNVQNSLLKGSDSPSKIIALGHSDGGPPSLAFMSSTKIKDGAALILGSQLSEKVPEGVPTKGFVGGFDQIFPARDMITDFQRLTSPNNPVRISWLSDHFTEQYDPILLTALSETITGKKSISSFKVGLGLFLFALGVVLAFSAGILTGDPLGERACYAWGTAFFVGLSLLGGSKELFQQCPVAAVFILFYLLGFNCGFVPDWKHLKPFLIFFLLMELNVVAGTTFFWSNLGESLPWLPLFLLWYPFAWICKIGLFAFSLTHRAFPMWMVDWYLPWVILSLLPFLFVRGIIPLCQGIFLTSPKTNAIKSIITTEITFAQKQTRLAVILVLVMLLLWCIRFSQGMIQADVMQAVAGNFMRTLLLPCFYLIFLVSRRNQLFQKI